MIHRFAHARISETNPPNRLLRCEGIQVEIHRFVHQLACKWFPHYHNEYLRRKTQPSTFANYEFKQAISMRIHDRPLLFHSATISHAKCTIHAFVLIIQMDYSVNLKALDPITFRAELNEYSGSNGEPTSLLLTRIM